MITCEQERIFSISGKYTQGYSVLKAKKGTIEALQIVSFAQANFCLTSRERKKVARRKSLAKIDALFLRPSHLLPLA